MKARALPWTHKGAAGPFDPTHDRDADSRRLARLGESYPEQGLGLSLGTRVMRRYTHSTLASRKRLA